MSANAQLPTSPGLSLQALLRLAKPEPVKRLVGAATVAVLEQLDPALLEPQKLAELALRLLDPEAVLKTPEQRDLVIGLLPLAKARELAERLGVADGRSLYADLRRAAAAKAVLPILYSFFGVVREERAPGLLTPDQGKATAQYALFEHQRKAAGRVVSVFTAAPRKTVLHMPTGAGKTRTAMHIVARHLTANEPTLVVWLAQNAELLDQAAEEFEKSWSYLGNRQVSLTRFWGGRAPDLLSAHDGVVVGGLGKMRALDQRDPNTLLRLADRTSLVVVDEAHQAIAPTYAAVITALYSKRSRTALLGLTATPGRTWSDIAEDARLSAFFDGRKVTLEVEGYSDPVSFLIAEGYLARPHFSTLNAEAGLELSEKDVQALAEAIEVPDELLERLGMDVKRNLRIVAAAEELATRHKRVIVFTPSVASARLVSAVLFARGYDTDIVTGETGQGERERIIRRFKSGAPQPMILCNFGVLTTGFDAPAISAALIARPTRSLVLYSQMVGRATRGTRAGGNKNAEIVTVTDPGLPGFGDMAQAFTNWEDVWHEPG
jgi:superfamily II DNA or RNA helicase